MHMHLVAAKALGFVERFVGGTHEGQEALWFGRRSDACAYRDLDRLFLQVELHCLHFTQDAFGQVLRGFGAGVRQYQHELFAADAREQVVLADARAHGF